MNSANGSLPDVYFTFSLSGTIIKPYMIQLWKRHLAKQGDIFVKTSKLGTLRKKLMSYKSLLSIRMMAIVSMMGLTLLGVSATEADTQTSAKQLAMKVDTTPATERILIAASTDESETQHDYSPIYPDPVYGELNLGETSQQIVATQQQILDHMQSCIQEVRQIHSTLVAYKQQEQELEKQIDQLQDQRREISYGDKDADLRRDELGREIDQLRLEERAIRDTYNTERRLQREVSSTCKREVNDLERQKRDLERQLEKQFRDSLDLDV